MRCKLSRRDVRFSRPNVKLMLKKVQLLTKILFLRMNRVARRHVTK